MLDQNRPRVHLGVFVPCSKTKVRPDVPVATQAELDSNREYAERRLARYAAPARDIYRGRQFLAMSRAVDDLRAARQDLHVTLFILSAGYGLIDEATRVVPYEAVLGSSRPQWVARGEALGLPEAVRAAFARLDYAIIALSHAYLTAASLASVGETPAHLLYLVSRQSDVPPHATFVPSGRREARFLRTSEREVRGKLLARLLTQIQVRGIRALESVTCPGDVAPA